MVLRRWLLVYSGLWLVGCLFVQKADVSINHTKYSPDEKIRLDFTCRSINNQECKCCVIDMLRWWIFSDIIPMRPPPSP